LAFFPISISDTTTTPLHLLDTGKLIPSSPLRWSQTFTPCFPWIPFLTQPPTFGGLFNALSFFLLPTTNWGVHLSVWIKDLRPFTLIMLKGAYFFRFNPKPQYLITEFVGSRFLPFFFMPSPPTTVGIVKVFRISRHLAKKVEDFFTFIFFPCEPLEHQLFATKGVFFPLTRRRFFEQSYVSPCNKVCIASQAWAPNHPFTPLLPIFFFSGGMLVPFLPGRAAEDGILTDMPTNFLIPRNLVLVDFPFFVTQMPSHGLDYPFSGLSSFSRARYLKRQFQGSQQNVPPPPHVPCFPALKLLRRVSNHLFFSSSRQK